MGLLCENEALTLLEKIMIHKFTYVNDDDNTIQYGAMAQDVRDVLIENNLGYRPFLEIRHFKNGKNTTPEISKDVNAPEEDVLYNMDYTKLIPIIWKGWQIHNKK